MVSLKAADTFQLIKSLCCRHLGQDRMACLLITPEYSSGTSVNTGLGCSHTIPSDTTLFDKLYLLTTSRSFYKNLIMLSLSSLFCYGFLWVCAWEKNIEKKSRAARAATSSCRTLWWTSGWQGTKTYTRLSAGNGRGVRSPIESDRVFSYTSSCDGNAMITALTTRTVLGGQSVLLPSVTNEIAHLQWCQK